MRYFPLGKAHGATFCNRVEETRRLIHYVENGTHTYLVAPRRYGKSSLCDHALSKTKIPSATLDFHLAVHERHAEQIILQGVTKLIGKTVGPIQKFQHVIKKYLTELKPTFVIGDEHLKLELTRAQNSNPATNIAEALLLLEKLLRENKKRAVLLLDEFQEIGEMQDARGIEGAIRHVAQETAHLSIIFSGSNPHLLEVMFEDERRPLYKLCRKLTLDRITPEDYKPHLDHAASKTWGKKLSEDVFEKIMEITERHPYYVNYLCHELWMRNKAPTLNVVNDAWDMVIEEEKSDLVKDFLSLPDNAKKIMLYIANHDGKNLYSSEVSHTAEISSGSIPATIHLLLEKNYIEKTNGVFRLITPPYKKLLSTK